jgi:hypothetical protein
VKILLANPEPSTMAPEAKIAMGISESAILKPQIVVGSIQYDFRA